MRSPDPSPPSSTPAVDLSLVIPAFDEAARIEAPLRAMAEYLAARDERLATRSEIVVVDDGSRDGTAERVRALAPGLPVALQLLRTPENHGKGHALKVGFEAARGARILFADADHATPIAELELLWARLEEGLPIAIGCRKTADTIEVHQPWYREQMGKVFTGLVRVLIADVADATCGFKLFEREAGRDIFSRLRVFDWSFDAELLLIARIRGHALAEQPVRWADQPGSKVRLWRDVATTLWGLVRIRWNLARGVYDSAAPVTARVERLETRPGAPRLDSEPARAGS